MGPLVVLRARGSPLPFPLGLISTRGGDVVRDGGVRIRARRWRDDAPSRDSSPACLRFGRAFGVVVVRIASRLGGGARGGRGSRRVLPQALHRRARRRSRRGRRRCVRRRGRYPRDGHAPRERPRRDGPPRPQTHPRVRRLRGRVERRRVPRQVRQHGPCLPHREDQGGGYFGAFNPIGWASREDYRDAFNAFLVKWPKPGSVRENPYVLEKVGGPGAAIFDFGAEGPLFGAEALKIPLGRAPSMGSSYAAIGGAALFGGGKEIKTANRGWASTPRPRTARERSSRPEKRRRRRSWNSECTAARDSMDSTGEDARRGFANVVVSVIIGRHHPASRVASRRLPRRACRRGHRSRSRFLRSSARPLYSRSCARTRHFVSLEVALTPGRRRTPGQSPGSRSP